MENLLFLIVSFLASAVGAICGIGGGVIIKPVLDLCGAASVSTISFLSGCTVLSMSCYSVGRNLLSGDNRALALMVAGGIGGGIVGRLFNKKMDNKAVDTLFLFLMSVIILISLWNVWKYARG